MALELIDALSEPGLATGVNDDAWGLGGRLAVVFDGATGLGENLMPGDSDAAWLARLGAARLAAHGERLSALEALRATAGAAEDAYLAGRRRAPIEGYEVPLASMMLVEATGAGGLDAFWFGDCAALVLRADGGCEVAGEAFGRHSREAAAAARLAKTHGRTAAGAKPNEAFLPALDVQGGRWLFGPTRTCADQARRGSIGAPSGSLLLLASDGFLALGGDYGRYDGPGLVAAAAARGLADLLDELRSIERRDPNGELYPRFKTSDDATAILLRVA